MAIATPIFALFKEQLRHDCARMGETHQIEDTGRQFIWWYFTRLLELDPDEIEEIVCDGSGDLGIDAIRIDEEELVHFYQFKNHDKVGKGIRAGDVDTLISGIRLIIGRNHHTIANEQLRNRIDEVLNRLPAGYRVHLVSSSDGIAPDSEAKLNTFVAELRGPSADFFT